MKAILQELADNLARVGDDVTKAIEETARAAGNLSSLNRQMPADNFRSARIYNATVDCAKNVLYANIDWLSMQLGQVEGALDSMDDRAKQAPPKLDAREAAIAKLIERAKAVTECMKTDGEPAYVDLEDLAIAVSQAEEALK